MAAQNNDIYASNPDVVGTAAGQYDKIRIERAPDAGGVAGAFAQIVEVSADAADEFTLYTDTGGEDTSWYRWRWYNSSSAALSNYSPAIQAGDSIVRQWLKADIEDEDITDSDWNRWAEQMLIDLYARGIWKHDRAIITPVKAADGTIDEWYDIPGRLRDIIRVERVSTDANRRHGAWIDGEWTQVGREIRIIGAKDPSLSAYQIHGKRQFRSVGEMTNDYFMLAHRIIQRFATHWREMQRANFYKFVLYDKTTDISLRDIQSIVDRVMADVEVDIRALAWPEPEVPLGRYP